MELPELTLENIKGAKRSIKINLGVMPKLRKLILKDCRNLGGLEIELGEPLCSQRSHLCLCMSADQESELEDDPHGFQGLSFKVIL